MSIASPTWAVSKEAVLETLAVKTSKFEESPKVFLSKLANDDSLPTTSRHRKQAKRFVMAKADAKLAGKLPIYWPRRAVTKLQRSVHVKNEFGLSDRQELPLSMELLDSTQFETSGTFLDEELCRSRISGMSKLDIGKQ